MYDVTFTEILVPMAVGLFEYFTYVQQPQVALLLEYTGYEFELLTIHYFVLPFFHTCRQIVC